MRKLIILKSLVDFVWIVVCLPFILLVAIFLVLIFINSEALEIFSWMGAIPQEGSEILIQVYAVFTALMIYLGIYSFYVFRKTLRYFMSVKPFHEDVIKNFNVIGIILSGLGVFGAFLVFLGRIAFENKIIISLGFSPYLMLLCLGLFFMVLSETFKVAKHAKEENELTI